MKAAVFHGPEDTGMRIEDIPVPQVGPDQILVKVAACGACHTDLHYIEHGVPTFKKPPIVLGHEASGIVEEVGVDVNNCQGRPAGLSSQPCSPAASAGSAAWVRENICSDMKMLGNHFDGAYAEYVAVPAKDVLTCRRLDPAGGRVDHRRRPVHALSRGEEPRPGEGRRHRR